MGLLDLKSDLLDLKFPTGINNKPLVVRDIKKIAESGGSVGENDLNNSALDVQGILLASRGRDIERMAKLVIAKPGLKHNVKQGLLAFLQAQDGKAQNKPATKLLEYAKDVLLTNVSNVAQVAASGLGVRLPKGLAKNKKPNDAEGNIKNVSHSDTVSRGNTKSKTFHYTDEGKVDYEKKPRNAQYDLSFGEKKEDTFKAADGAEPIGDIIPFFFKTFGDASGKEMDFIQFRAYLDSFSDDYNASWNKTQYLGRPEMFKNYQGFERMINFSFKAAAEVRGDLMPLHNKLQTLASVTAPTFADDLFMRGTLVKVTIGDYLIDQPGNITSVQLAWEQDYPWEINKENDSKILRLPHVLNVTVSMEAIHNFVPKYMGLKSTSEENFIGNKALR